MRAQPAGAQSFCGRRSVRRYSDVWSARFGGFQSLFPVERRPACPTSRYSRRIAAAQRLVYKAATYEFPVNARGLTTMASYQYIYVMKNLSKAYPGGKKVVENVSLSFLPGAKIGVLGVNGSGKSTLMRIMGGIDSNYQGEAWAADGVRVGYLEQEPQLDASKDVLGNVMDGVGDTMQLINRFNEVSARFGEELSDDEMNDLI